MSRKHKVTAAKRKVHACMALDCIRPRIHLSFIAYQYATNKCTFDSEYSYDKYSLM